jgi:hypothetical protein
MEPQTYEDHWSTCNQCGKKLGLWRKTKKQYLCSDCYKPTLKKMFGVAAVIIGALVYFIYFK